MAAGERKRALSLVAAVMVAVGMAACVMLSLGNPAGVRSAAHAVNQLALRDPGTWTKAIVADHVSGATHWSKPHLVAMLNVADTMLPSLPPVSTALPGLLALPPAKTQSFIAARAGAAWRHGRVLADKLAHLLLPSGDLRASTPLPFVTPNLVAAEVHAAWQHAGHLAEKVAVAVNHAIPDQYGALVDLPNNVPTPLPFLTPLSILDGVQTPRQAVAHADMHIDMHTTLPGELPADILPLPYLTPKLVKAEAETAWRYAKLMAPSVANKAKQALAVLPKLSRVPQLAHELAMPGWIQGTAALTQHAAMVSSVMQACWRIDRGQNADW